MNSIEANPAPWVKRFSLLAVTSRRDTCGLVVQEAMSLGKPAIGANAGGVPEQIADGQTGFIFAAGDTDALAARIAPLLSDRDMAARMGERGRQRVMAELTPEGGLEQVAVLYERVLADRGGTREGRYHGE